MNDVTPTDWSDLPSLYAKRRERRAAEERDSLSIGNLTSRIASSPEALASHLDELRKSLPNSATTGSALRGRTEAKPRSDGTALGVIDAGLLPSVEQAWQARDAEALDLSLCRLLKRHAMSLAPLMSAEFDVLGYRGSLPESLRPLVERINAPAGPKMVNGAAARCLAVTKSRATDGTDLRMMLAVFADELAEFPEDVVATAFRKWARREKWWPSLAEILDQCQRLSRVRASLKRLAA